MTQKQLARRWEKLLQDCIQTAKAQGAQDPHIFIEGGSGLCVVEGPQDEDGPVLLQLPWPQGISCDVGAW
jgi:hypothetical protein